ncbi:MAG: hypothetical protein HYV07_03905 [Deltaproteobacteria bacterium]|nr:hypothetical protein [Deltaproteobacteria bacterium]
MLASEWALMMEAEDEFLRRATSGELAFLELAQRRPAGSSRSLVILDAGPEVLGAPRVVQLAALFALEARCFANRAHLDFSILQDDRLALISEITPASIKRILATRSADRPRSEVLERWAQTMSPSEADDVWLVGGPTMIRMAAETALAHASSLELSMGEDFSNPSVRATVVRRGAAKRAPVIELLLPPSPELVRVLRDPFGTAETAASPSSGLEIDPRATPIFGAERRVLARLMDGRLAAIIVPGSIRATIPAPLCFRPPGEHTVVAATWHRGHVLVLVQLGSTLTLLEHGKRGGRATLPSSWSELLAEPPSAEGREGFGPLWVMASDRRRSTCVAFVDRRRQLVFLDRARPDPAVVATDVRDAALVRGRLLFAGRLPGSSIGALYIYDPTLGPVPFRSGPNGLVDPAFELDTTSGSATLIPAEATRRVLIGHSGEARDVVAIQVGNEPESFRVLAGDRQLLLSTPTGSIAVGIARTPRSRAPGLVLLDDRRLKLSIASVDESAVLATLTSPIRRVAVSGVFAELAFTTELGELCVFDLGKGQLTLRIRPPARFLV